MNGAPRKQHLISEAILKRFSTSDDELISYDLRYGKYRSRNVSAVAYQLDFVTFEARAAENLWSRLEEYLPAALDAINRGDAFETPGTVDTLKGAIALHFMRRKMVKQLAIERHAVIRETFFARPDLPPMTDQLKAYLLEWFDGELPPAFSENLREMHLEALQDIAPAGLEIWEAEIPLVIGDAAILTTKNDQIGFVPFMEASSHALPVGRWHLVALGPEDAIGVIPAEKAREFNRLQMRQAHSHVFLHPADNQSPFVDDARAEQRRRNEQRTSEQT